MSILYLCVCSCTISAATLSTATGGRSHTNYTFTCVCVFQNARNLKGARFWKWENNEKRNHQQTVARKTITERCVVCFKY